MGRIILAIGLSVTAATAGAQDLTAPAILARGRVLVEGQVEGVGPYPFLLDTCLREGVLHEGVDLYLSLPRLQANGDGLPLVMADPFQLGPLPATKHSFAVADLSELAERLGQPLGGIVPAHQPGFEMTLDFPGRKVAWRGIELAELPDATAPGAVPLRFDDAGAPQAQVLVNGTRLLPARIDTAYAGVLAMPETRLKDAGAEDAPALLTLLPGGGQRRQVQLESVTLGGARLRQVLCEVVPADAPARLGLGFLQHYRLTLNYEHGLARVDREASSDLIAPPALGTGIVPLAPREDGWTIGVIEGSAAALSGIGPEHVLVQVQGRPVSGLAPDSLQAALNGTAGQYVSVVVRMGEEQREHVLACGDLLRP